MLIMIILAHNFRIIQTVFFQCDQIWQNILPFINFNKILCIFGVFKKTIFFSSLCCVHRYDLLCITYLLCITFLDMVNFECKVYQATTRKNWH